MATLRVAIEGIALWMDRGSYWEVLFPKALRSHLQHVPRMHVTVGGIERAAIPLVGQTLDLLHLAEGNCGRVDKTWMLSMPARTDSPAHDDQVATTKWVVASVLLPRLELKPVSPPPLTGPVEYDDHEPPSILTLDFGTEVSCDLEAGSVVLVHRDRTTGVIADKVTVGDGTADITVRILNFTEAEHNKKFKKTVKGEALHDVQDLFALTGWKLRSPRYTGEDLGKKKAVTGKATKGMPASIVTYPYKLCPQGDGG